MIKGWLIDIVEEDTTDLPFDELIRGSKEEDDDILNLQICWGSLNPSNVLFVTIADIAVDDSTTNVYTCYTSPNEYLLFQPYNEEEFKKEFEIETSPKRG